MRLECVEIDFGNDEGNLGIETKCRAEIDDAAAAARNPLARDGRACAEEEIIGCDGSEGLEWDLFSSE